MPNLLLQNPTDVGYDIVLAIGQSNMSGYATGLDAARLDTTDSRVYQYGASGSYANGISLAVDPLAHPDAPTGLGPALHFARWYALSVPTNRRVLIVPAARGGTPFEGSSSPSGYTWKVGRSDVTNLYETAITQVNAAKAAAGANARIVAIIMIHGESDGDNGTSSATYKTDMDALISGFRSRLSLPNLPVILGAMVPEYCATGNRNVIHLAQLDTPNRNTRTAFAWGAWGNTNGDGNHYNATGQRTMARRLFAAYQRAVLGQPQDVVPAPTALTITAAPGDSQITITAAGGLGYGATYALYRGTTATGSPVSTTFPFTDTGRTNGAAVSYIATATTAAGTVTSTVITATPVASVSTYSADSFTRSNSTTVGATETGGYTWTSNTSNWSITSNKLTRAAVNVSSSNDDILITDGQADGTVGVVFSSLGTGPTGLLVRVSADRSTGYAFFAQNGTLSAARRTNATSGYSSINGNVCPVVAGDRIDIVMNGSSFTVKRNGSAVGSFTDANATGTRHGVFAISPAEAQTFDDWSHTAATS